MPPEVGIPLVIVLVAFWILIRCERRPNKNVRVPRETLWERTRKYHEGDS